MSRKSESITLSVNEEDKVQLESIALQFDCTWGDKPNISKLIKQIANGELLLSKSDKPAKQKRKLIKDAIASIQDELTILLELI
ncbi:MAG: hypothetical protein ACK52E_16365 [Aphanizomenon sp.]|jgi:hypothetical protein